MSRRQQRRRASRRRTHMAVASGGLAVVATLGTAGVAQAQTTFTVTNTSDCSTANCGSLREAIAEVNADKNGTAPGDSIVFASGVTGTIQLSGSQLNLYYPATITGPGANLLTIKAASGYRALYAEEPTTISGLTFTGGHPASSDRNGNGGAIFAEKYMKLSGVVISGNTAAGSGGGVHNAYYGLTIDNSTISGNSASGNGGGANTRQRFGGSVLTVNDSTISGNTAAGNGGGLYGFYGAQVNNSTVADNTAPSGAGLSVDDPGYVTDSTIAANTISSGGNGGQVQQRYAGYLKFADSIISGSGSAADVALPSGGTANVQFSLIRNPGSAGSGYASIPTGANDVTGLDPQLGPLAANGGPTETMAPAPTSPVLDRGNSEGLTTDQRGLARPFVLPTISFVPTGGDHSDIGAFEAETPTLAAISPSSGGAGTQVAIAGVGFTGATRVMFGSLPATSVTVLSDTAILATAPAQNGGTQDVRVLTPLGESPVVAGDKFTFASFSPSVTKPHAKRSGNKVNTGIKVSCPAGGFSCSGSWKATAAIKHHKTRISSGSISLGAGQSKTLSFKLGSKAMKQLKSKGSLKITIQITVADGNGSPVTVNRTITVHYKKPKHHKKH